jgi:hypothetical protein
MTSKLTLTESMSELRHKLLTIEQRDINEGILSRLLAMAGVKNAEKEIIKELGEKVTITNAKGQKEVWTLKHDDSGTKYHLEGGDARISPEDMKGRKAKDPKKEPSIPPEVTEPHPTLLGPDGKPLQVPAKAKPVITDPVVKAIENMPISTDHPDITNMGELSELLNKRQPKAMKALARNPEANKGFWNAVVEKAKPGKKTAVAVAVLIALLIWWANKAVKTDQQTNTANAGSKTSSESDAPIGTTIPGDEMNWLYINAGNLAGQSITKGKDGVWKSEKGRTAVDPEVIKKIEELAKQSSEVRKQNLANQNNFSVELWDGPASGGVSPDISTSQSAPAPTTTWGAR